MLKASAPSMGIRNSWHPRAQLGRARDFHRPLGVPENRIFVLRWSSTAQGLADVRPGDVWFNNDDP
jgi:hypothetical protein